MHCGIFVATTLGVMCEICKKHIKKKEMRERLNAYESSDEADDREFL